MADNCMAVLVHASISAEDPAIRIFGVERPMREEPWCLFNLSKKSRTLACLDLIEANIPSRGPVSDYRYGTVDRTRGVF